MIGAREVPFVARTALATLMAALIALAVIGRAPFAPHHVHFAVDTASAQQPWSATSEPANAELSAQGVELYPHYRFLSERWNAGEWPLWNRGVDLGVPEAAHPKWGAYDPQVWILGVLERIGGRELFDRGFAWLAWMRISFALLGAWCLARTLGLGRAPATFAALGFGLSAAQLLWLHFPQGHVVACLPWILLGIERLAARVSVGNLMSVFVAMWLAVLGGDLETSCFVGLTAGVWCLHVGTVDRRAAWSGLVALAAATLCSGPLLAPFAEYLANSGVWIERQHPAGGRMPDWVALGAVLIAIGVILRLRSLSGGRPSPWLVGLIVVGLSYALAKRGLADRAALSFWPDLFGRPQDATGYGGAASFLETASAWVAIPILVSALACLFGGVARHARFELITTLGALALALAWEVPGVVGLWRSLPVVGLVDPARAAPVAALLLSLAAAGALQSSPNWARRAAVIASVGCALLATLAGGSRPLPSGTVQLDPPIELVRMESLPAPRIAGGSLRFAGALHPGLPAQSAELLVQRLDPRGNPIGGEELRLSLELAPDRRGWSAFDSGALEATRFTEGEHLFTLRILAADSDRPVLGELRVAHSSIARKRGISWISLAALGSTLILLWMPPAGAIAWLLVLIALVQGLWFGRGWNPLVPREQNFPPTETEAVLKDVLGPRRLFAEPGILPSNTPLVSGLATLGGSDALHTASFDAYRVAALQPGAHPWFDWNARHAATPTPAFRMLGVGALLLHSDSPPRGFTTIAGPVGHARSAEVFIAVPDDPLPVAVCVPRITPRAELIARVETFDPLAEAFVEADQHFEIDVPFRTSDVFHELSHHELERFRVTLDGTGLFMHCAQTFAGWEVTVDGEPRDLLRVNSLFRGVRLSAGEHMVEFRYRPSSRKVGWGMAIAGVALLALGLRFGRRTVD